MALIPLKSDKYCPDVTGEVHPEKESTHQWDSEVSVTSGYYWCWRTATTFYRTAYLHRKKPQGSAFFEPYIKTPPEYAPFLVKNPNAFFATVRDAVDETPFFDETKIPAPKEGAQQQPLEVHKQQYYFENGGDYQNAFEPIDKQWLGSDNNKGAVFWVPIYRREGSRVADFIMVEYKFSRKGKIETSYFTHKLEKVKWLDDIPEEIRKQARGVALAVKVYLAIRCPAIYRACELEVESPDSWIKAPKRLRGIKVGTLLHPTPVKLHPFFICNWIANSMLALAHSNFKQNYGLLRGTPNVSCFTPIRIKLAAIYRNIPDDKSKLVTPQYTLMTDAIAQKAPELATNWRLVFDKLEDLDQTIETLGRKSKVESCWYPPANRYGSKNALGCKPWSTHFREKIDFYHQSVSNLLRLNRSQPFPESKVKNLLPKLRPSEMDRVSTSQLMDSIRATIPEFSLRELERTEQLMLEVACETDWCGVLNYPSTNEAPADFTVLKVDEVLFLDEDARAEYSDNLAKYLNKTVHYKIKEYLPATNTSVERTLLETRNNALTMTADGLKYHAAAATAACLCFVKLEQWGANPLPSDTHALLTFCIAASMKCLAPQYANPLPRFKKTVKEEASSQAYHVSYWRAVNAEDDETPNDFQKHSPTSGTRYKDRLKDRVSMIWKAVDHEDWKRKALQAVQAQQQNRRDAQGDDAGADAGAEADAGAAAGAGAEANDVPLADAQGFVLVDEDDDDYAFDDEDDEVARRRKRNRYVNVGRRKKDNQDDSDEDDVLA